jgi:endonuclease G, mitochondrial
MAKPPDPGKPRAKRAASARRPVKSEATAIAEGVAAVTATLAAKLAEADRRGASADASPPPSPPPAPPVPPPSPLSPPAPSAPTTGSRVFPAAKSAGAVAPLAVAALALLVPEQSNSIAAPPVPPAREAVAAAGGTAPPALTADGNLPAVRGDSVTPQCLSQFAIDLPHHRGDDVSRRQTLICRQGYVLSFNADTRSPDWVMERLEEADLRGTATRGDRFLPDPDLPREAVADNADYLRTGFDRGHQAPAADAKFSQRVMDESFFFTNMSPQRGIGMNRGAWKFLEEATRSWVLCGGRPDLYVITGPIYGAHPGNPATIGTPPVAVPRAFYKIVYDPNMGRAVGFVMRNERIGSRVDLQQFVVPIAEIETETGLNFFRSMDGRTQARLKDDPGIAWANPGPCPGDSGD